MVGERAEDRDRLVRVEEQLKQAISNQDESRERHHRVAHEVQTIRIMMERGAQQQENFLQVVAEQTETTKQIADDVASLKVTRELIRQRLATAQRFGLWAVGVLVTMFTAGDHLAQWVWTALGALVK